jgi:predicted nucleic acid-binding protein
MSDFVVLLDANVLVPAALRDTLLRLAEEPRLYRPRWSEPILGEVSRTLEQKLSRSQAETARLRNALEEHFPEACVTGFEGLSGASEINPKDRHVVAAAVRAGAQTIVTYNLKHFPRTALDVLGVEAQHPDEFLVHQLHLDSQLVLRKLHHQAAAIGRTVDGLLAGLEKQQLSSFVSEARAQFKGDG